MKRSVSDAALENPALQRVRSTMSVDSSLNFDTPSHSDGIPSVAAGAESEIEDSDLFIAWPQHLQPQQQQPASQPAAEDDDSVLDPNEFRRLLQKTSDEQQNDIRNASKNGLKVYLARQLQVGLTCMKS